MVAWDTFAVIVALVAIPLTTSPHVLQAFRSLYLFLYQKLYPVTAQCERLQWADVPDGYLFNCPDDCSGSSDLNVDADCLESTLGSFFQRAWVSPSRRDKTVPKPKQLSLETHYVRSDTKLLKAYLLMDPFSNDNIRFYDLDGVLTAHLVTKYIYQRLPPSFEMLRHIRHRCTFTKREIELILEGYPPDYSEQIVIPQGQLLTNSTLCVSVPSPIQEWADIHRGGWIIGAALHRYFKNLQTTRTGKEDEKAPSIGHVMQSTTVQAGGQRMNDFRPRQRAVLRIRHVFNKIMEAMPDQEELAGAALEFINPLFLRPGDKDSFPNPDKYLSDSIFLTMVWNARLYQLSTPATDYFSRNFAARLSGTEWTRAMNIFNHFDPLSPEDVDFLRPRLVHILQAAATGLWDVYRSRYKCLSPILPDIPELREGRHVYIYDCKQGQNHGEGD